MPLPDPIRTGKDSDASLKKQRTYIAIDLKSFYASVECVDRGFDPLTTNLVVADPSPRKKRSAWRSPSPSRPSGSRGGHGFSK